MDFAERLKLLREEYNLSREDLANNLNISYSAISKYEQNVRFPDKNTLNKIADFFGVSTDYLLGRTDERLPAHLIKKEATKYNVNHDPFLDDLLKKVPDLTDKEKESLKDHMEFALKLIEKERKNRAKKNE